MLTSIENSIEFSPKLTRPLNSLRGVSKNLSSGLEGKQVNCAMLKNDKGINATPPSGMLTVSREEYFSDLSGFLSGIDLFL